MTLRIACLHYPRIRARPREQRTSSTSQRARPISNASSAGEGADGTPQREARRLFSSLPVARSPHDEANRARAFGCELQTARGFQGQAIEFAHHAGHAGMAEAFFHGREDF